LQDLLYTAGDYVILAYSTPIVNASAFTRIVENVQNQGTGTIFKKEFRYSFDEETFSEFAELNLESLAEIKFAENASLWFQFRYTLMSGGPAQVQSVTLDFTTFPADPFTGFVPANKQDESRIYAYPVSYKAGAKWNPYKMNRAIRLFKDLNLMVNSLFGHDVLYYRALPQGRSKDVYLLEYSLYEHEQKQCIKVIVPENTFPDNKFNMGPFGVDFEFPFEIQIDKEYFQAVFGDGSGPQKRDVIYFPRTNRIYEVSSSYLFRDFMNEPLYFKVSLQKGNPKSNAEMFEDLSQLEDLTVSVEKLFGVEQKQEGTDIANPVQFEQNTYISDPVRSFLAEDIDITDTPLVNFYLNVAEYQYHLKTTVSEMTAAISLTAGNLSLLTEDQTYYARFLRGSTQPNDSYYSSMKKLTYKGTDNESRGIFVFSGGESPAQASHPKSQIFGTSSQFYIYENEYSAGSTTEVPLFSCGITSVAKSVQEKVIEYNASGEFTTSQDRAISAWFRIKPNDRYSSVVNSFTVEDEDLTIALQFAVPHEFFVGDTISLRRASGGNFNVIGEVKSITDSSRIVISVSSQVFNYTTTVFPTWKTFTDLRMQLTYPKVIVDARKSNKGVRVDLLEKRYFRVFSNEKLYYFILPNTSTGLAEDKWYNVTVSMSNLFAQLTLNVWEMQWNETTNLPATSDLRLIFGKTETEFPKVDRSSGVNFSVVSSDIDLTNVRVWNQKIETDKQPFVLNQNVVKDASKALVIDNAIPRSRLPYISYTH
jgi:hypothetical protein